MSHNRQRFRAILNGARRAVLSNAGYPCVLSTLNGYAVLDNTDTALDNLHAAAFTAEMWFKLIPDSLSVFRYPFVKSNAADGWRFLVSSTQLALCQVKTDGAQATITSPTPFSTGWNHVAMQYDNDGDRKVHLLCNGALLGLSNAATGSPADDSAEPMQIFNFDNIPKPKYWGWARISMTSRYTDSYAVPPRYPPPATDADTMALIYFNEMTGATSVDHSGNGHHATLAGSYAWVNH